MRSHLRAALVLALTIGLLAYFLRDVKLGDVWEKTREADARLLALGVGVTLMTYVLRAFRWQYLLAPIGPTRFATAFQTTVIGFAASFLLPARAGEVLRPYLLARREGLPPTACFATIILERLLDLVTVLLLFGLFVVFVDPASLSGDPAVYARVKAGGLLPRGPRWPAFSCSTSSRVTRKSSGPGRCASSGCCRRVWRAPSRGSSRALPRGWQ